MLRALRKLADTWIARAFFVLLVLSFAVWGVGDMVKGLFAPDTSLAKVAGEKIPLEEGQTQLRRELDRLQRQLGTNFEANPQLRRALAEQTVDQLVLDRALRAEQRRLGVAVPDAMLRDFVFGIAAFRGADGRFSRVLFENFLRQNGLSEPALLALVRSDLGRQQLALAVNSGASAPAALTQPLVAALLEQRAIALVLLPAAEAPEPPAPEAAQLARFHENNPERFSAPEYREGTLAVMNAALLSREVEVSEADLLTAYDARRAQFDTPETRGVVQVLVDDPAKAQALANAWRETSDPAALATKAEAAGGTLIDLGSIDRTILPVPELAEVVFALADGAVSAPVQSPSGWDVFRVQGITPGRASTLDEVRATLSGEIAQERAADLAFEREKMIEDALAGGASLAEVATRFNLATASFRMDAEGLDARRQAVPLPVPETVRAPLIKAVFAAESGAAPRLKETEAGFVAVDLRAIVPPALRPFAEVKEEVLAGFLGEARLRLQEARAAKLLQAVNTGIPISAAAAEAGLGVREVGALTRALGEAAPIPRALLEPIFELKPKQATMARTEDGFAVAQLLEISPAEPPEADLLARIKAEASQALLRDIEQQYGLALRARSEVQLYPRMLDALAQP